MTFRKSKLIENRPSRHSLRLCDKFGSQGNQIGTENLFQPSKQTGSFDVILAKRILRAEDSRTEFVVLVEGKEYQVQENAILQVQTDKYMMFLLVIAMESSLLLYCVVWTTFHKETKRESK